MRNRQASMCVLSDEFNREWVQVDGGIEVVEQPEAVEALVEYYRSISGEHPDWAEYRRAMIDQGKVLLPALDRSVGTHQPRRLSGSAGRRPVDVLRRPTAGRRGSTGERGARAVGGHQRIQ